MILLGAGCLDSHGELEGRSCCTQGLKRSSGEEGAGAEPAWAKATLKQMEERMHGKG